MNQASPQAAANFISGYWADARNRNAGELAPPSKNLFITSSGSAVTRPGFEDTEWDLANAGYTAEPFWISEYNVTFFAFSNALKYVDHDSSNAVYDTGLTLTAASQLSYYNGCIYVTNPTDGVTRISITRLKAAATTSSTSFTIEDGTIYRFETSGNLRIKGTNEAFIYPNSGSITGAANNGSGLIRITSTAHKLQTGQSITITDVTGTTEANATWTITRISANTFDLQGSTFTNAYVSGGTWNLNLNSVIALSSTSSQAYAIDDLAIQVHALSLDKFKKIVFWKECMHGIGPQTAATNNQAAKRTLFFGDFADAGNWKSVEDFSSGLSGTELIGRSGTLVNMVAMKDYLYLFTDHEAYSISVADVNTTTGARPPQLFSPKYGCLNDKCAVDMDGRIVFLTQNKRVIRSKVNLGGLLEPDEQFDEPIRNILTNLDDDQSAAFCFFWEEANYLMIQVTVERQNILLIYDNNPIVTAYGATQGRWLPPIENWQVTSFFTANGNLYGTDIADDTVYQFATGQTDDGADIETVFSTGELNVKVFVPHVRGAVDVGFGRTMGDWGVFEVSGGISQGAEATWTPYISEVEGKSKTISSEGLDFGSSQAIGELQIGKLVIGGNGTGADFATFDKSFRIAPPKGRTFQAVISSEGDGYALRIDSWRLPQIGYYPTTLVTTS